MHYFSNKFSKIAKHWGLSAAPQHPLIFNFGELKLRIWPNCGFSSWLWRNRTSKNHLWRLRHEKRHQNNVTKFFYFASPPTPQSKFLATSV